MSTELEFENAKAMITQLGSAISVGIAAEGHDELALLDAISCPISFMLQLGQAQAACTYALCGKISKELAMRTLDAFLKKHSVDIAFIVSEYPTHGD